MDSVPSTGFIPSSTSMRPLVRRIRIGIVISVSFVLSQSCDRDLGFGGADVDLERVWGVGWDRDS